MDAAVLKLTMKNSAETTLYYVDYDATLSFYWKAARQIRRVFSEINYRNSLSPAYSDSYRRSGFAWNVA